jgi:hypothetical protein
MTSPWWTFRQGTSAELRDHTFMVSPWNDVVMVDGKDVYLPYVWPRILEITQRRWPTEYAIGDLLGLFDKEDQNVRR